jgi:hypothetical protein
LGDTRVDAAVKQLPVVKLALLGIVPLGHGPQVADHPGIDFAILKVPQHGVRLETGITF